MHAFALPLSVTHIIISLDRVKWTSPIGCSLTMTHVWIPCPQLSLTTLLTNPAVPFRHGSLIFRRCWVIKCRCPSHEVSLPNSIKCLDFIFSFALNLYYVSTFLDAISSWHHEYWIWSNILCDKPIPSFILISTELTFEFAENFIWCWWLQYLSFVKWKHYYY